MSFKIGVLVVGGINRYWIVVLWTGIVVDPTGSLGGLRFWIAILC